MRGTKQPNATREERRRFSLGPLSTLETTSLPLLRSPSRSQTGIDFFRFKEPMEPMNIELNLLNSPVPSLCDKEEARFLIHTRIASEKGLYRKGVVWDST